MEDARIGRERKKQALVSCETVMDGWFGCIWAAGCTKWFWVVPVTRVGVEDLAFEDEGKGLAGVVGPMGADGPERTDAVWAKENLTNFEQVKLWIFKF
jgi:hypothetical protein